MVLDVLLGLVVQHVPLVLLGQVVRVVLALPLVGQVLLNVLLARVGQVVLVVLALLLVGRTVLDILSDLVVLHVPWVLQGLLVLVVQHGHLFHLFQVVQGLLYDLLGQVVLHILLALVVLLGLSFLVVQVVLALFLVDQVVLVVQPLLLVGQGVLVVLAQYQVALDVQDILFDLVVLQVPLVL